MEDGQRWNVLDDKPLFRTELTQKHKRSGKLSDRGDEFIAPFIRHVLAQRVLSGFGMFAMMMFAMMMFAMVVPVMVAMALLSRWSILGFVAWC